MFSFLLSRSRGNYRVHHCRFQCHVIENRDAVIAKDEVDLIRDSLVSVSRGGGLGNLWNVN